MTAIRRMIEAAIFCILSAMPGQADKAVIAVAANFLETAEEIVEAFEKQTGHEIIVAHGSTGRLYAQVVHGAPFDLFLSADRERPRLLLTGGFAVDLKTYAVGRLVLLSHDEAPVLPDDLLGARVALANAELAPYGLAAEQALTSWGIKPGDATFLRGDSVGQAASLFSTGNANFALVSASLADASGASYVLAVPETLYDPILQDIALLSHGAQNPASVAFYEFLSNDAARVLIARHGYGLPEIEMRSVGSADAVRQ